MAKESPVMVVMPTEPASHLGQLPPHPGEDEHHVKTEAMRSKSKRRKTKEKDEDGDLSKPTMTYECRFCKMRFKLAQALGGHMNRHRQERENEQFQNAQQLVSLMAQQQMPRSWASMMASENLNSATAAHWARLSTGDVGLRPQLPQLISFTTPHLSMTRASSAPSPTMIPDSQSTNFYLPSNASMNELQQHMQWNVDAALNFPRSASLNALESLTGAIRDDFLSGMLQQPPPRHDSSFESQTLPGLHPLGGGLEYSTSHVAGMCAPTRSTRAHYASPSPEYLSD